MADTASTASDGDFMALTLTGEIELGASRGEVWDALNDYAVLRECIPGCETLEPDEDGQLVATAVVKIGPVTAKFLGRVTLSDIVPEQGYRISGTGLGGLAGYAKGGAVVALTAIEPTRTRLAYDVQANVGGKIAQLGARLLNSVAKKYADSFFQAFAAALASRTATDSATPSLVIPRQ
jgi:hypothetical protein